MCPISPDRLTRMVTRRDFLGIFCVLFAVSGAMLVRKDNLVARLCLATHCSYGSAVSRPWLANVQQSFAAEVTSGT